MGPAPQASTVSLHLSEVSVARPRAPQHLAEQHTGAQGPLPRASPACLQHTEWGRPGPVEP